jgi:TonB family protein
MVSRRVLGLRQVRGHYPAFPSVGTRDALQQSGQTDFRVRVRVCVARSGKLALVDVVAPSGDHDIDADAVHTASAWRFRPGMQDECAINLMSFEPFYEHQPPPRPILRR